MKIPDLRRFTPARVGLGRSGHALPTSELLGLRLAEIRAREAVHAPLDLDQMVRELFTLQHDTLIAQSAAPDRIAYMRRPDWGRRLDDESRRKLRERKSEYDIVFTIADGLSAVAVHSHAKPLLTELLPLLAEERWRIAPFVLVTQGRVAIADEIGEELGAALAVMLIGERPGLSACDSLGAYLTWHPRSGLTDADRNCISNIRRDGLPYNVAARRLAFLVKESRARRLSGVALKEDVAKLALPSIGLSEVEEGDYSSGAQQQ